MRHYIHKLVVLIALLMLAQASFAAQYVAGDLAPRAATDNALDVADLLILERFLSGAEIPTAIELLVADVAPVGAPDGVLNVADLMVLQRAVMGKVSLGTVTDLPPAPTLNTAVSPTTLNPYQITGTSTPGATVSVYANGGMQQQVVSDLTSGTFSFSVYLFDGVNTIYATETDGINESLTSNTLLVAYNNTIVRTLGDPNASNNLSISVDTVWTPGIPAQPYIITTHMTIDAGVKFIIQPGTVLQFDSGKTMIVNGELIVAGDLSRGLVRFTSSNTANPAKGQWNGIIINSAAQNVVLDYVLVEYANTGVLFNGGGGTIQNSRIENSYSNGIDIRSASPLITNNLIKNNSTGINVTDASSPNITQNTVTLNSSGVDLSGDGSNIINNPTPVIINNSIHGNVGNISAANYANSLNIIVDMRRNWWGTTDINAISAKVYDFSDQILSDTNSNPVIDITQYLDSENGLPVIIGNYINGPLNKNMVVPAGSTYLVIGSVLIPDGLSLTIGAGAALKFVDGSLIRAKGDIVTQGTSSNPVLFTGNNIIQQPKDWYGIKLESTATGSVLDNVIVEFSDFGIYEDSVSIAITNSIIRNNLTSGIYLIQSSPSVTGNLIESNGRGVYIRSGSNPSVSVNTIKNNRTAGIYVTDTVGFSAGIIPKPVVTNNSFFNETANYGNSYFNYDTSISPAVLVLDATNNWWGSTDINRISAGIRDDAVSGIIVDYSSFLGADGGAPVVGNFITGQLQLDTVLLANTQYTALSSITVPAGITLTLQAGASLLFADGASLYVDGNLNMQGTASNKVTLRSNRTDNSKPASGIWGGVSIRSGAGSVTIDYAVIEYASAGIDFNAAGGNVSNSVIRDNLTGIRILDASPTISANIIASNGIGIAIENISSPVISNGNKIVGNSDGVVLRGYAGAAASNPVVTGNSIYDNRIYNYKTELCAPPTANPGTLSAKNNWWGTTDLFQIKGGIDDIVEDSQCPEIDFSGFLESEGGVANLESYIRIRGTLTADTVLAQNQKYIVDSWLIVPAGISLTIGQGAELLFSGFSNRLKVEGTLIVQGTASNPVLFKTAKTFPTANINTSDWYGIEITSTASNVIIDYAIIEDAERGVEFNFGAGVLQNSVIRNNVHGIYISGSQLVQILNNIITSNTYNIYLNGRIADPQPVIANNDIYDANLFNQNVYFDSIESTTSINLSDNWWNETDALLIQSSFTGNSGDLTTIASLGTIATQPFAALPLSNVLLSEQYISPVTSAGVKDSVLFTANLVEAGSWVVDIQNNSNTTVMSYSGASAAISETWDGKDQSLQTVPDGLYRFNVTVTASAAVTYYYGSVVVDNKLPVAVIDSPLNNATINSLPFIKISGTLSDQNLGSYQLSYANSFTQDNAGFIQVPIASGVDDVIDSRILNWKLYDQKQGFQIQPGNKTLRLTVTDKAGNSSTFYTQLVFDYPSIYNVSHSPKTINPVKGELSTINFTLGTPGTVTLKVAPEAGGASIYESAQVFSTAGDYSMTWDGKTTSGNYIVDEAYSFVLELSDGVNTIVYTETLPILRGPGRVYQSIQWFSITKNQFWKTQIIHSEMRRFSMTMNQIDPNDINVTGQDNVYSLVPFEASINWIYWDGRDANGVPRHSHLSNYFMRISLMKPLSIIVNGTRPFIHGGRAAPDIEVKPSSYKIRHSYDEISTINYQIDQSSNVTVKLLPPGIYDPTDPSAILIEASNLKNAETSPGVPAVYSFTWKGYDDTVSAPDTNNINIAQEGRYTFTIEATSIETGNTTIYRGNLGLFY